VTANIVKVKEICTILVNLNVGNIILQNFAFKIFDEGQWGSIISTLLNFPITRAVLTVLYPPGQSSVLGSLPKQPLTGLLCK
jgi:hypothetical protein